MSTLEARLERLEKVAGPVDPPCFTVEITREGSRLLTAGEEGPKDAQPARKQRASGHVCSEHCVRISINRRVKPQPAVSEGTRGDGPAPQLALLPPADASTAPAAPTGQPDPPRSPEPVCGGGDRLGERLPGVPARDAVVEMEQTAGPEYPAGRVEIEMRQEAAAVAAALSLHVQSTLPWWLPVAEAPLGLCAIPYCGHPALQHRGPRTRLPCRVCGFRAEQHDPDGYSLEVPQHARRVSPCSNYRAIHVDEEDSDRCEHPACGCRGWRRWVPTDPRSELMVLQAQLAERDRVIAENAEKLARIRGKCEAAERELLRATSGPSDLGASPHGCPVYVEGDGA